VISTPSPDPTPSATPRVIVTATPSPSSTPAAPQIAPRDNLPATKAEPKPTLANITGLSGTLVTTGKDLTYKFGWKIDLNARSYSINVSGASTKKSLTSSTNSIEIGALTPGNYTMVVQAIDGSGKLSKPTSLSFLIPAPKIVKFITTTSLSKPIIDSTLTKSLERFVSSTTLGFPVNLNIEYTKSRKNQIAVVKLQQLVEKYLKDNLVGSAVAVSLIPVSDSSDLATLSGTGSAISKTLLIRKK
jgi:predicted phage tail protein